MRQTTPGATPSQRITHYIAALDDWRGETISRLRKLIHAAAPELIEQWKWNVPLWSLRGNVVAVGAFKDSVKLNFFDGAALKDAHKLFNAGLQAKNSRAIDFARASKVDERALKELIHAAAAFNAAK